MTPTAPTQPPKNLLGATYEFMQKGDYEVPPTYDEFEQLAVDDPAYLNDLHTLFKEEKWTAADNVDEFRAQMLEGVKKKPSQDMASGLGLPDAGGSVPGLAQVLSGTGSPDQPFVQPQLVAAPAFEPGTQANPAYLNYPEMGAQEPRGPMPLPSTGDSPRSEQEILDAFPGSQQGDVRTVVDGQPLGKELEKLKYGYERVLIPPDYQGGLPTGTFKDPETGLQYFDRQLSNKVNGKEQSAGEAAAGAFKNSLYEMAQGVSEGAQALTNLAGMSTPGGMASTLTDPATFGDEASAAIEGAKTPIADLYAKSSFGQHKNVNTALFGAAEYAPLVVAQVAQTLAPELRAPAAISRVLGLVTSTAFEAQMVHSAHENALKAGLKGADADLYTVLEGGLVIGGFKAGSKLMASLGDKLATKIAPAEFREKVALDAVARIKEMQAKLGRELTKGETSAALSQSLRAALPGLAQVPKEMFQQAPTFAGVEAARIGANQVAAPALGGKADDLTLAQAGEQVLQAGAAGAAMGAVTGGTSALLGGLAKPDLMPGEPAPLQAAETPVNDRTYSVRRPTGQVEMENVRVHAVSADGKTAVVRGVDSQGTPVEREVPTDSLRENIGKPAASPPNLPSEGEGVRSEASLPQPESAAEASRVQAQPRTITLPKPDGSPNFLIDVDATGQPTRLYTPEGREFPLSILETNPAVAQEVAAAITQSKVIIPDLAPADPSIVDVTGTPPEIIPPAAEANDPLPADAAPVDSGSPEQSPVEAPVPDAGAPDAAARPVPAAADRTAVDEAVAAYNDLDTVARNGLTGVQQRAAIKELADQAGLTVEMDAKSKVSLIENSAAAQESTSAAAPETPSLSEQNQQAKAEFNDALQRFRAASKKGGNRAQSSLLGIPALTNEQAVALRDMVHSLVKIGTVKTKQILASLRSQGVTAQDVSDKDAIALIDAIKRAKEAPELLTDKEARLLYDVSKKEAYVAETSPAVAPVGGNFMLGSETVESTTPAFYTYTSPRGKVYTFDLTKTRTQGGQTRYVATSDGYTTPDAGLLFDKDGDLVTARNDTGKTGLASALLRAAKKDMGTFGIKGPASQQGYGFVRKFIVREALADGKYQRAVADGRITAAAATDIIKGAGLEVPSDLATAPTGRRPAPTAADAQAAKQELADAFAAFKAARKKGGNRLQSSAAGIPAFSPEEASAIKDMVKAVVKLGVVNSKRAIAKLRSMGLTEDDATDDQLLPLVRAKLKEDGVFKPKQSGPRTAAEGTASRERKHAKRYNTDTQAGLTDSEKNYVPAKEQIGASEKPADYIKRVGEDAAYERALGDPAYTGTNDDAADLLHDNLIRGVAEHFTDVRNKALTAGNTELADSAQEKLLRLAGKLSQTGTRQAKALQARVGAGGTIESLVDATDPAATGKATVSQAYGEISNRNAEHDAANEADAKTITKRAKRARKEKMDVVLETPAVKAAIEKAAGTTDAPAEPDAKGYGEGNKVFTKKGLAELRARLKTTAFSAPLPPDLVYLGGYHLEASTRKFSDWSKKMLREVGARVKPRLAELYEASKAELLKKDPTATGFNTADEVSALVAERDAPGAVQKGIKDLGKTIAKIAKQHAADINTDRRTLTKKFIEDAGLSGKAAGEMAAAIESEWNKRKQKGAWQSIGRRFQAKRSRARLDALDRLVNDLNAASNLPETTMRSPVAQILEQLLDNKVQISAAEAQEIERLKDAYVKAAEKTTRSIGGVEVQTQRTREVVAASVKFLQALGQLKNVDKSDWSRKSQALYFASLLSSPNTHLANAYLNAITTAHEVGMISTLHTWAETKSLNSALQVLKGLDAGYARGLADAQNVLLTGNDRDTKASASLNDAAYETDPAEEGSIARGFIKSALNKVGLAGNWTPADKSATRYVRRALGASDTFFQGGLAEARAREIAEKMAARAVKQRQVNNPMTPKEVREYVRNEADRLLFRTPEAIADIKAIVDNEGLTDNGDRAQFMARNSRIGELLDQSRAAEHPEMVEDYKAFAARHAGNSPYEGHLGAAAYNLSNFARDWPVIGKIIVPFSRVTSNFQNRYGEWFGLGFYRAIRGGAGKPLFPGTRGIAERYQRDYTPEEQEKAFLRSTMGVLGTMGALSLVRSGVIAITGLPSGNKDDDERNPPQSIILLNGRASWSYKGTIMEIPLMTLAATLAWQKRRNVAGDDPSVKEKLGMVSVMTVAAVLNAGPTNAAGDFLGAVSEAHRNPNKLINQLSRMGTTGAKTLVMPAGLTYTFNLYNQATSADMPEKRSNDYLVQVRQNLFGDIPVWQGGAEAVINRWGNPMKYNSKRFWGVASVALNPDQEAVDNRLAELGIDTGSPRITDANLRLFDPSTGKQVTQMTNAEFRQYMEVRGRTLWSEIAYQDRHRRTPSLDAILKGTPQEATQEMGHLLEIARDAAKQAIIDKRAAAHADVRFGKPKP